jgi:hypothetical protein
MERWLIFNMEISPENIAQLQHEEWIKHPCTIQMLKLLDEHKSTFVDNLSKMSSNPEVLDATFRCFSYGIATIDTIKRTMTDTNVFIRKTIKQYK